MKIKEEINILFYDLQANIAFQYTFEENLNKNRWPFLEKIHILINYLHMGNCRDTLLTLRY